MSTFLEILSERQRKYGIDVYMDVTQEFIEASIVQPMDKGGKAVYERVILSKVKLGPQENVAKQIVEDLNKTDRYR